MLTDAHVIQRFNSTIYYIILILLKYTYPFKIKMYRIDEHTKHKIVYMCEEGVSKSAIAEELGISVSKVILGIHSSMFFSDL